MEASLRLYVSSSRNGDYDLYLTERNDASATFGPLTPISELNTGAVDAHPWVSADERYMIFGSDRDGDQDLYETSR